MKNTFAPRPNYWAALLWRTTDGCDQFSIHTPAPTPNVYVYAHCLQNHPGGVALLVINADRQKANEITLPSDAERYTLTAQATSRHNSPAQWEDASTERRWRRAAIRQSGNARRPCEFRAHQHYILSNS